ncbi:MAG: putative bifunctional diguanylate cyclase/phosphodiesterase [Sphingorhabdus sp.]
MTDKNNANDLPKDISAKALLGFETPSGIEPGQLEELQARSVKDPTLGYMTATAVCSLLILAINFRTAPLWALAVWGGTVFGNFALWYTKFNQTKAILGGHAARPEYMQVARNAALGGLVWGSALPFLGHFGEIPQWLGIWSIGLALMVYASMAVPGLPIVATVFITVASIGNFIGWILHGEYYLAIGSVALGILLIFNVLRSARALILYEFASNVLHEKSETVSLLLREFEDSGADWLWQTDTSRCVTHASPRFARALDAEPRVIEGQPLLKLIAGDSWETGHYPDELHDLAEKLKRRESFSNLIVPVTINGNRRWWELSASPRQADDGAFLGFRGVGSDVTEQRESAEKISHLARFDTLTGLPNRLQLTEALGQALSEADQWRRRCGFMMIDLDRFKAVNDTLGHPIGDRLLAQVAKRLKMIMSPNELCGRLGGDEFAVVLKDASDAAYVSKVAKTIIETLSKPYEVDQNTLYIGASVGSAVGPIDGRTVELLMRSADLALYRSKDEGGNIHHSYQHKLHANAEERRVLEFELRNALKENQFHLQYQPVVDARNDHQITGFEALLRWNNPKFGMVSPAKFVPVAEDARLIVPLGNWVLRQACSDAMQWPENVKIAVNVSVDQLTSPGFVEQVVQALHDTGLPAWRLEIEVTESIFVRDGGLAVQVLDRIRKLGIKLSLDDFGTGYSSLGYLSNIRFDTIKVDRSFVTGASKGKAECIAIIRAVVAMADALNIKTTAEGVENEQELTMIQQFGCDKIQGYYFGRPMVHRDSMALFSAADHHRNVA